MGHARAVVASPTAACGRWWRDGGVIADPADAEFRSGWRGLLRDRGARGRAGPACGRREALVLPGVVSKGTCGSWSPLVRSPEKAGDGRLDRPRRSLSIGAMLAGRLFALTTGCGDWLASTVLLNVGPLAAAA